MVATGEARMDLSGCVPGVYLLRAVASGQVVATTKVVVTRK
jgi:hypothetical protein